MTNEQQDPQPAVGKGGARLVPKVNLAGVLSVLLEAHRLHIAPGLTEAATLARELRTFRVKEPAATGNESLEAWRERPHDDLVLAVAAWQGERYRGPWRMESFGRIPEPAWGRMWRWAWRPF